MRLLLPVVLVSVLESFSTVHASETNTPSATAGTPRISNARRGRTPVRQMRTPERQIQDSNNPLPETPAAPGRQPGNMDDFVEIPSVHPVFAGRVIEFPSFDDIQADDQLSNRLARISIRQSNLPLTPSPAPGLGRITRVIDLSAATAAAARINRNHQASQGPQQQLDGQNSGTGQGEAPVRQLETPGNSASPLLPPAIQRGQNAISVPFFPSLSPEEAVADLNQGGQVSQVRTENVDTDSRLPNIRNVILPQRTDQNFLQRMTGEGVPRPPLRPRLG